jgi:hypothetical protein
MKSVLGFGVNVSLMCAVVCSFLSTGAVAESQPRILINGQFHADEVPINPGRGWLALSVMAGRWQLTPTRISTKRVYDPVLDENEAKTGILIESSHPEAIAYVRVSGIAVGQVETPAMQFLAKPRALTPKMKKIVMFFHGRKYEISARSSTGAKTAVISIASRRGRTEIAQVSESIEGETSAGTAELLWAGDLDRDGALDLILRYQFYNASSVCLFLSSQKSKGGLVGKLDCVLGVGC